MGIPPTSILPYFAPLLFAAPWLVRHPGFRAAARARVVRAVLLAAALAPVTASTASANLLHEPRQAVPEGVHLAGGGYVTTLAALEIHRAVTEGNLTKVESLLSAWPELVDFRDENEMTPLFFAAAYGHRNIARLLLDRGADLHAPSRYGAMPFHQAAFSGHVDIVLLLLSRGEDVDVRDRDGRTALHLTAWKNRGEVARILVQRGARVDAMDRSGEGATPLHYAAAMGSGDVALQLLENCAEIDAVSGEGATPLHLAIARNHPDLVRLLLAFHAEVTKPDAGGRTVLDLVKLTGEKEMEDLLLGRGGPGEGKRDGHAGRICRRRM